MRNSNVSERHKEILSNCQGSDQPETLLFTHNVDVERLNQQKLDAINKKEYTFEMQTGGIPFMIDTLKRGCLSPEKLQLKEGAVVMFTRNNFKDGYVNGTIGHVHDFVNGRPRIKLKNGQLISPEKAEWMIEEHGHTKAWIKQFPLRLAWAVTVHKSQGMSLDTASIDLSSVFEYGQGYVAISRVRSLAGLHLIGLNDGVFKMHPKVIEQDALFRAAVPAGNKLF